MECSTFYYFFEIDCTEKWSVPSNSKDFFGGWGLQTQVSKD